MNGTARRFAVILLAFALLVAGVPARAAEGAIRVVLGNQELTFDVPPALVNGRVLVPLRKIFETLGAKVAYDGATRQITAYKGPITVELTIDNPSVRIDGETKQLDVPPRVVDGRTLVPLRFVTEALGGQVAWDPVSRTVSIVTPEGTTSPADMVLTPRDLPGGKWTELESPGELPSGWKKVMLSNDPAEPYLWISSSLQLVGEGAGAWVQERTCRSGETEIAPPKDLLFWNTAKFCQSWDTLGNLVVSTYVAAGEYVLTMAASPRSEETTVDDVLTTLEGLAVHQLILLGKLARGEARPAPLAVMPAKVEKPAQGQDGQPPQQPGDQPKQPPVPPPAGQGQPPVLQPVDLPPAPAPLQFDPPKNIINVAAGKSKDPDKFIFSFCDPRPKYLTSPCGPMPQTTNPKGGNPPYHFVLGPMGGFPPMGVSVLKDGHLVGEPALSAVGKTFKFNVCAEDLSGNWACGDVLLQVGPPDIPPLQFVAPILPKATVDRQYQAALGPPTGGQPPYRFRVQGTGMPTGLWLNADGTIEGWPVEAAGGKTHKFQVCVADSAQQEACADVSLQVDPRPPTLVEQFQNTAWTGTFTINFAKYGARTGTIDFTIGPDTGDTRIDITDANVTFQGWRFKPNWAYLACINDHSCQGVYFDFDLLEDGPQWSQPSSLEWNVRYLKLWVDIDIESDSAPPIVDSKGVTHQLTPTSMKGIAETYSLNPPGTFSATRR